MMSSDHVTWVVTTDSATCRIYQYSRKTAHLLLLKELTHPENKLRDIDLTSDKPGHYKSSHNTHGAYSQQSDPKEIKIENFSREIATALDQGRNIHAYENLIIIAASHMKGLLFQHINRHVKDLVTHSIEKDLIHLPHQELLDFLRVHTQYSDES
ncbi:MAG TPA: host attachment protein [Gammaproteobacteria bacterium]|nr:host attachment protein [Gammaproteobacteria bacterium]